MSLSLRLIGTLVLSAATVGCLSQNLGFGVSDSGVQVGTAENRGRLGRDIVPGIYASDKYVFKLMRYSKSTRNWESATKIPPSPKGVNLIIHGLRQGEREGPFEITPEVVFHEHGLVDFSKNKSIILPPADRIDGELYAMMWDSRHPNPVGLENLLMRVNKNNGKPSSEDLDLFLSAMEEDLILDQSDSEFFMHMFFFYRKIFKDYRGPQPHFAGFSKGAHVAIKLAEYAAASKLDSAQKPQTVALLDPYVGPAYANGNIGKDLLVRVKKMKAQGIGFLNIQTSEIQSFRLMYIPTSDEYFFSGLRETIGEIKVRRNKAEEEKLKEVRVTGNPVLDRLYLDHSRALQFWYGSVLACKLPIPSINDDRKVYPFSGTSSFETPKEISDWIYDGIFDPRCANQSKPTEVF